MSIQDEWLERFKAAVAHEIQQAGGRKSDGYRAVEAKTGLGYDYIYQIYNGKPEGRPKRPSAEAMDSLQAAYGSLLPAPAPEPSNLAPSPTPAPGEMVVRVPLLANAGSMGTGTDVLHDDILVGQIDLSERWVAQRIKPTSPQALRFIHAYGDSMSPTFEDGDVLLVDTGLRDPRMVDGVYVMAANDRLYVKRVRQRLDGTVEISSDNNTVKTVDVLNGGSAIDVLGRVVWCWNGRKL